MRFTRRRSSINSAMAGPPSANAFPQQTFYDEKTHPIPPYLEISCEPSSAAEGQEADAAAGGATQSVLKRVSSFSIMSRVSSHLPQVASSLSLTDGYNAGDVSSTQGGEHKDSRETGSHRNPSEGPHVAIHSPQIGITRNFDNSETPPSWRLRDRMKTVGVGLVMALNVGTDPPDIIKPHPCAKLQCWMDPSSVTRQKAKEKIGERLEAQYARWQQQRAARPLKYRRALDPTVEDVRALCLWLRRQARHERILFHYNGHGVPRPTANGEIWVFDKNHTEYIPLSVTDLRQWMGKPTIVVLDCSSAGILIPVLTTPIQETPPSTPPHTPQAPPKPMDVETAASHWVKDTIVLCPTAEGEWLPMHPDYPADIFTSCLTTPIQIALRWFVRRNRHSMGSLNPEAVDAIPGQANDRKTPLGELNWIFTAVTDSIAWNVLPKELFQRLFRQDLLVASMFRNFLLADRILRSLNCTPQSYPPLPPGVADHPLWQAWDLACETCLFGLLKDGILGNHVLATAKPTGTGGHSSDDTGTADGASSSPSTPSRPATPQAQPPQQAASPINPGATNKTTGPISSISSPFFSEQLTAFEIWLEYAERHQDMISELESPEQLPVVLQVLLSQVHRVRALELLRRFLLLGPWAVNLSLSLGIFPYVMKLLQSPEYKSLLVSIWASILKFDPSCQVDLVKDGALPHFVQPLASWGSPLIDPMEAAKQRTLSAFSLAATCYKYPQAQTECLRQNLHGSCIGLLTTFSKLEEQYQDQLRLYQQQQQQQSNRGQMQMARPQPIQLQLLSPTSRVWLCVCLGNMVQKCPPVQREAYHTNMHICLLARLRDDDPHVRAAAAYSLGCLLEYAPDAPPPIPPAMSLGPGLVPQNLPPPTFQPGQPILVPQHMSATTMTVGATALTASAVLSGRLQPTMGQPNLLNPGGGAPAPLWPQGVPMPLAANQLQLGGQPLHPMRGGPPSLQPHGGMPQLQPQGPVSRLQPQQPYIQPVQELQPLPGLQPMQQLPGMQPMQQLPGMQPMQQLPGMQPMQQLSGMQPIQQLPGMQPMQQLPGMQPMQPPNMQQQGRPQQPSLMPPGQHPPQGLRLGGQPMPTGAQMFQQQNIVRPQGAGTPILVGQMMGPGGPQLMGGQLGQMPNPAAPLLMNPIPPPNQQQGFPPNLRRRPTVYEDRRRLELDLSIVDPLIRSLSDGSSTVRYEALMALSNFVEKYMAAFLVVAERGTTWGSDEDNPGTSEKTPSSDEKLIEPKILIPIPDGLNKAVLERFASYWQILRNTQRTDVHPSVVDVASAVVGTVNEQVMDMKLGIQAERSRKEAADTGLTGIAEEDTAPSLDRSPASPDLEGRPPKKHPQSDGPTHRLPTTKLPLRRTSSDQDGMLNISRSPLDSVKSSPMLLGPTGEVKPPKKIEFNLPKSSFYSWRKDSFKSNFDDMDEDDLEDRDPLNPNGAARAYRQRRNYLVQNSGRKLADQFVGLKPKPPQKKQELDLLLEESDEDADDKDSALKGELKLRESKLLKTSGVKMTSMLKFHSYEDILMVCDEQDGISIWDYEKGTCNFSFKNGNKKGSRMTSAFWINEQTKSLFFVGCNDGSARLWSKIIEDNGETSSQYPTLSAAFFAVPDLQTGQGVCGMICELQQYSGTLIAGGHSKHLRCWDLSTEKCSASFETGTEAVVTALTTAWDEDQGMMQGGYSGMGPDVVVAGHSDGSLKLFDIRSRNAEAQIGGRPRRHTKFTEHRSWIVDVSFTSYGGRFEVISGSVAGDIRAWDLRTSSSLRTLEAQRSPMTALAVHKQIPIAATGSHAQFIKILTLDGEALQVVRFHEEMAGHRIGPVSCLEFHKQKLVLAAGATNSLVSIYKPKHPSVVVR